MSIGYNEIEAAHRTVGWDARDARQFGKLERRTLRKGSGMFQRLGELDLAVAIDQDPGVEFWMHLPPPVSGRCGDRGAITHSPDFLVRRTNDTKFYVDVDGLPEFMPADPAAAYVDAATTSILDPTAVLNRAIILRYGSFLIPPGEQVRLISALSKQGSTTLAQAAAEVRDRVWSLEVVLAMGARGFVSIEVRESAIGPSTPIRLADPSLSVFARHDPSRAH